MYARCEMLRPMAGDTPQRSRKKALLVAKAVEFHGNVTWPKQ
jgi:hypothetical protein